MGRTPRPEMGEGMSAAPPRVLEAAVRRVLPPAAREHVLGDLQERFAETGSVARYLLDAALILPYVLGSQARRNVDARLAALEAVAVAASCVEATHRVQANEFSSLIPGVLCTVLVALTALILGDTYVEPRNRARFHDLRQYLLAYGAVGLAGLALGGVLPWMAIVRRLAIPAAQTGFVLLFLVRISFAALNRATAQEAYPASLDEVREEVERFHRIIRQRNLVEYWAAAAVGIAIGVAIFQAHTPVLRAGLGLEIAGVLCVAYGLNRRASTRAIPSDLAEWGWVAFYRRELTRQRDALYAVPSWYIGPLVPGMLLIAAARRTGSGLVWRQAGAAFPMLAIVLLIVWLNRRAARALQSKIDALDEWEQQS